MWEITISEITKITKMLKKKNEMFRRRKIKQGTMNPAVQNLLTAKEGKKYLLVGLLQRFV